MPVEGSRPHDPAQPLPDANPELLWLEPAPASLVGPEASLASRESVQLAFVTALQQLPATPAAINSALQRGRATLDGRKRPSKPVDRALLERYMQAWERGDAVAFAA